MNDIQKVVLKNWARYYKCHVQNGNFTKDFLLGMLEQFYVVTAYENPKSRTFAWYHKTEELIRNGK